MCLDGCARDNPFETCCCFKCGCSLSPCCAGVCGTVKCCKCCSGCCPCLCWPPRQCMAWFLGLLGFLIMWLCIGNNNWITYERAGLASEYPNCNLGGKTYAIENTRYGLFSAEILCNGKWRTESIVKNKDSDPSIQFEDTVPGWLGTAGLILVIGELVLIVALVIVFLALCSCIPELKYFRNSLFRIGMYLFLLSCLLFVGVLIFFPFGIGFLGHTTVKGRLVMEVPPTMGWAWGVVILVFTGALLLLLDKPPKSDVENKPESEKLL